MKHFLMTRITKLATRRNFEVTSEKYYCSQSF